MPFLQEKKGEFLITNLWTFLLPIRLAISREYKKKFSNFSASPTVSHFSWIWKRKFIFCTVEILFSNCAILWCGWFQKVKVSVVYNITFWLCTHHSKKKKSFHEQILSEFFWVRPPYQKSYLRHWSTRQKIHEGGGNSSLLGEALIKAIENILVSIDAQEHADNKYI